MRSRDVMGQDARILWHKDETLGGVECVLLPGGFSYGDYLRTGAIARFSPIMKSVAKFAADGGLVIGTCNGFQILCEAHLLPGALTRNRSLSFICERVYAAGRECEHAVHARDASRATCCACRSSMARDCTSRLKMNCARWKSAGR